MVSDAKKRRISFRRAPAAGAGGEGGAGHALHLAGFQNGVECKDPIELRVLGKLPSWLKGSLLRPGPGAFDIAVEEGKTTGTTFSFRHIFDAPGMVHKFDIGNGAVSYRSTKLNRGTESHIRRTGQLPEFDGTFGQPAGTRAIFGMTGKLWKSRPKLSVDDAVAKVQSNAITMLQGKLVATSGDFVSLDPGSLQPLQRFALKDISPVFKGELCCGMPVHDARTGDTFSFTLQFVSANTAAYRICCIPDRGQPYVLAEYGKDEEFVYMHSFAVTEHYVVMCHWPAVIRPMKLLMGQQLLDALAWKPEKGSRFLVFDRRQDGRGLVATYRSEAVFAFHHINAFETLDGSIAVDVMAFDDMSVAKSFKLKHLRKGRPLQPGRPLRFMLEGVKTAKSSQLLRTAAVPLVSTAMCGFEMARVDMRRSGLPYRMCYSLAYAEGGSWFTAIVKLDVVTAKRVAAWELPHHFPSEPIFVPQPGSTAEDCGIVLSVVLQGVKQRSFLLILDALTFTEIARAPLPHALPFGFHGHFIDGGHTI